MKVYKVCLIKGNKLTSCCANPYFPEELRVEYTVNKTVRSKLKGSKLFAFDDLNTATRFATLYYYRGDVKVFEAEATGVGRPRIKQLPTWSDIKSFWAKRTAKKRITDILDGGIVPFGTVWCDSIKLLKEISL